MGTKGLEGRIAKRKIRIGGASKKGRQHVANQEKYRKQGIRTTKNKNRARQRHLDNHPNDLQAKSQIKKAMNL